MRIIQQLPPLRIPNLLIVEDVVKDGLMVTIAGIKSPWAFIRLWEGDQPKWVDGLKYIKAYGTKGAPYKRHILELFKSQRDAWMIGGQGPLEAIHLSYHDHDETEENAMQFVEMNSCELLESHGYHDHAAKKRITQNT